MRATENKWVQQKRYLLRRSREFGFWSDLVWCVT